MEEKKMRLTSKVVLSSLRNMVDSLADEERVNAEFENSEILKKLDAMIESLDNKSSTAKMSPNQLENETFKPLILDFLSDGKALTASEIWRGIPTLKEHPTMTNQRVAAILRIMKESGMIKSEPVKGKTLFSAI